MMKNTGKQEQLINDKLNSAAISDYAPNGFTGRRKETVQKIVTGVTAKWGAAGNEAVRLQADAVIVHHVVTGRRESRFIRGIRETQMRLKRYWQMILTFTVGICRWMRTLGAGSNAQLAALLGITVKGEIEPLVPWGSQCRPRGWANLMD